MSVIRSFGNEGSVLVTYESSSSTALSGLDFAPASGQLLFTPGQKLQQVALRILDDSLPEGPEVFSVNITAVALVNMR